MLYTKYKIYLYNVKFHIKIYINSLEKDETPILLSVLIEDPNKTPESVNMDIYKTLDKKKNHTV